MDISQAAQAKSDQLNAVDIIGIEPVIRIRDYDYDPTRKQQKLWIYFDGDNNRPWKPSVGMIRVLMAGWGKEADEYIGRYVKLFVEPTVTYAGEEVGGIRIRGMSDVQEGGFTTILSINRKKRIKFHVDKVEAPTSEYPADKFEKALPAMKEAMESGKMTLQQVIAQCQKTGQLTVEQMKRLESSAPVEIDDEAESFFNERGETPEQE